MVENLNLYQRLACIRGIADVIRKNKSGYGYKYASEDEILARVKAGMSKYHVTIYPEIVSDTVQVERRDYTKKKYSKTGDALPPEECVEYTTRANMNMHIVNDDNPNEQIIVPWFMLATSSDTAQSYGSALTYANRYFHLKFFNIATPDDDPDSWRQKKMDALEKENTEAAKTIVARIDKMVRANTTDTNKDSVVNMIKKYVRKDDGKPSANYFDVKDVDVANTLFAELTKMFNVNKEE